MDTLLKEKHQSTPVRTWLDKEEVLHKKKSYWHLRRAQDILLSGMALAGEFLDFVCFQRAIRITKENILIGKTADVTTAQVEEVLKKYIGRV